MNSPDWLRGILSPGVLTQHHLSLILQVLHLTGVFQSPGFCIIYDNLSEWNIETTSAFNNFRLHYHAGIFQNALTSSWIFIESLIFKRPGLNNTTALWQANSGGSTWRARKRDVSSWRIRMSDWTWTWDLEEFWACSVMAKSGEVSMGMLHWMAHNRNNSDQDSSNKITWRWVEFLSFIYASIPRWFNSTNKLIN